MTFLRINHRGSREENPSIFQMSLWSHFSWKMSKRLRDQPLFPLYQPQQVFSEKFLIEIIMVIFALHCKLIWANYLRENFLWRKSNSHLNSREENPSIIQMSLWSHFSWKMSKRLRDQPLFPLYQPQQVFSEKFLVEIIMVIFASHCKLIWAN